MGGSLWVGGSVPQHLAARGDGGGGSSTCFLSPPQSLPCPHSDRQRGRLRPFLRRGPGGAGHRQHTAGPRRGCASRRLQLRREPAGLQRRHRHRHRLAPPARLTHPHPPTPPPCPLRVTPGTAQTPAAFNKRVCTRRSLAQKRYLRQAAAPHLHSMRPRARGEPPRPPAARPKLESMRVLSASTGSTGRGGKEGGGSV